MVKVQSPSEFLDLLLKLLVVPLHPNQAKIPAPHVTHGAHHKVNNLLHRSGQFHHQRFDETEPLHGVDSRRNEAKGEEKKQDANEDVAKLSAHRHLDALWRGCDGTLSPPLAPRTPRASIAVRGAAGVG